MDIVTYFIDDGYDNPNTLNIVASEAAKGNRTDVLKYALDLLGKNPANIEIQNILEGAVRGGSLSTYKMILSELDKYQIDINVDPSDLLSKLGLNSSVPVENYISIAEYILDNYEDIKNLDYNDAIGSLIFYGDDVNPLLLKYMIGRAESVGYVIDYNQLIENTPYSSSIEAFLYLENVMIEKDININYDEILSSIDAFQGDDGEIDEEFKELVLERIIEQHNL